MSEMAKDIVKAAGLRRQTASLVTLSAREIERAVYVEFGDPVVALAETRAVVPSTDALRSDAERQLGAARRRCADLSEEWAALRGAAPEPDVLARAAALPSQMQAANEHLAELEGALASPWPDSQAVLRGVEALGRVALRQHLDATTNHLDERLEALRRAAAQVLALVRRADEERVATEAAVGKPLHDARWSAEDVALVERVARLTAVRIEARAPNAA